MSGTMLSAIHIRPHRQSEPHFIDGKPDAKDFYQGCTTKICDKTKVWTQDYLIPKPMPCTTLQRALYLRDFTGG